MVWSALKHKYGSPYVAHAKRKNTIAKKEAVLQLTDSLFFANRKPEANRGRQNPSGMTNSYLNKHTDNGQVSNGNRESAQVAGECTIW